jgi:hypothetical protein
VLQSKHTAIGGQLGHDEHHRWTTGILQEGNVCSGFTKEEMCALSAQAKKCTLIKLQHFLAYDPLFWAHVIGFF